MYKFLLCQVIVFTREKEEVNAPMKAIVQPVLSSDSECLKLWLARINYVLITNIGPCFNWQKSLSGQCQYLSSFEKVSSILCALLVLGRLTSFSNACLAGHAMTGALLLATQVTWFGISTKHAPDNSGTAEQGEKWEG